MAKKLMRLSKTCSNRGTQPMCIRKELAMCILYENPYMKPGPCSRMEEEFSSLERKSKEKKYTLIEALLSRGPLIDRLIRYLLRERSDDERKAELNEDLLDYAYKGDLFGVRVCLVLGADPDARDKMGRTPLMRIAIAPPTRIDEWGDRIENKGRLLVAAEMLLAYKANPHAEDDECQTARDLAELNGFHEFVEMLDKIKVKRKN